MSMAMMSRRMVVVFMMMFVVVMAGFVRRYGLYGHEDLMFILI